MEPTNVFELEHPISVRIKDDLFKDEEVKEFIEHFFRPRIIYVATKVLVPTTFEDDTSVKKYYKLAGIDEFFDEDYFLYMTNVYPN